MNKVVDFDNDKSVTENLIGSEISEIISREIIPVLSMKTVYQYLEGLIIKQNDEDYENLIDKRKLLLRDKTNYFK